MQESQTQVGPIAARRRRETVPRQYLGVPNSDGTHCVVQKEGDLPHRRPRWTPWHGFSRDTPWAGRSVALEAVGHLRNPRDGMIHSLGSLDTSRPATERPT